MTRNLDKLLKIADKIYLPFFLILTASLPFSYQPLVHLSHHAGASYDLTIIYLAMFAFALISLPLLYRNSDSLLKNKFNMFILVFFVWCSLSIIWSKNDIRAIVTSGLVGLAILVFFSIQLYATKLQRHGRTIYLLSVVMLVGLAAFALWQLFGDALGISGHLTLLPPDYQSKLFGFARITGFSAEPEFLGSLLLAPLGVFTYLFIKNRRLSTLGLWALVVVLLTLTLSRGALIAGFAVVVLTLLLNRRELRLTQFASITATGFGALIVGIALLTGAAALNTRDNISAYQAFSKAVSQLSMGTINFKQQSPLRTAQPEPALKGVTESGYVEASTSSRLQMSSAALELFSSSPANVLLGVGIGSFGTSLHQQSPRFSESSIVNNQYLEVLTELGVIGFVLFIGFFTALIYHLARKKQFVFLPIILGMLLQWLFFSGYPNVLHLWVILALALVFLPRNIYLSQAR